MDLIDIDTIESNHNTTVAAQPFSVSGLDTTDSNTEDYLLETQHHSLPTPLRPRSTNTAIQVGTTRDRLTAPLSNHNGSSRLAFQSLPDVQALPSEVAPWNDSAAPSSNLSILTDAFANSSPDKPQFSLINLAPNNQHESSDSLLDLAGTKTSACGISSCPIPALMKSTMNSHEQKNAVPQSLQLSQQTLQDLEHLSIKDPPSMSTPSSRNRSRSELSSSSSKASTTFHTPDSQAAKSHDADNVVPLYLSASKIDDILSSSTSQHERDEHYHVLDRVGRLVQVTESRVEARSKNRSTLSTSAITCAEPYPSFESDDASKVEIVAQSSSKIKCADSDIRKALMNTPCYGNQKENDTIRTTDLVTQELLRGRDEAKRRRAHQTPLSELTSILPPSNGQSQKNVEAATLDLAANDNGHDTASETEDEKPTKPKKLSQKKAAERLILQEYMHKVVATEEEEAPPIDFENLDDLTTKSLVKYGSDTIITTPREYQIELFELAKTKNVIAVLDTGSGKTLIAVLLLKHVFEEELAARHRGETMKMSFFLVNSVQLVFQQHNVLCNNLMGQPMERFCGGLNSDLWDKRKWEEIYENNMVVVCTADVLFQALHHGYITMSQINILIFDEAHHAKKGNVYARIIKDFYTAEPDLTQRPKIFGMTASPVDSRTDVHTAATQLENLLHAQIITAADPKLLQYAPVTRDETIIKYNVLRPPFETELFRQLKNAIKGDVLSKIFTFAKQAASELGPWCADQVWPMCLSEEQCRKLEAGVERKYHKKNTADPISVLDAKKAEIRAAKAVVDAHIFDDPKLTTGDLSSKVLHLMDFLQSRYERKTNDKCIVFVNQRYTAMMLVALFNKPNIGTPFLKPGFLVGQQNDDMKLSGVDGVQFSASNFRAQLLTLSKFRKGQLNCLFATSVAEEGLDVPDCNVVVRFDLYTTMIQYIQSRGRARLPNSKYIHMIENHNREHNAIVLEVNNNERTLRHYCQNLDGSRLLSGNDHDMDLCLAKERKHRRYKDPNTGSVLTYRLSLMVLEKFITSLPQNEDGTQGVFYNVTSQGKDFVCEIMMPSNSPVTGAVGRAYSTKQVAKCSAAFEACLALRKSGYLNEHFISTFKKSAPAMRNALLAINSKKQSCLRMRTKPELWSLCTIPTQLFLTIMILSEPGHLKRPSQPLGLLTRTRLPDFPEFPLYFGRGKMSMVKTMTLLSPLTIDTDTLQTVDNFTLRIFDDMFSKVYESDLEKMPYWLVPITISSDLDSNVPNYSKTMPPTDIIAWEIVDMLRSKDNLEIPLDLTAQPEWFKDRFIVDIYDGSRKFFTVAQAHHLKPLDPLPPDVAIRTGSRHNSDNILEYSISLWAKSRARRVFKDEQPVIEAELLGLRRNLLDDTEQADATTVKKCFIVLEPLRISVLPTTVLAMGFVFPAIIHRLESYLITVEACQTLGLQVEAEMALEAMTKDSDNTEEHRHEQTQFQRGMGKNYERLEFLGDSFLKMAASIALYGLHPESNEQDFHVRRMLMICNQNLLNVANKRKLYEYIRSQGFNRRAWYPEGLNLIKGKQATAPNTHDLNDKTIADVSEALIGATYLSSGVDATVYAVRVLVDSADHPMECWDDYYKAYNMPKYQVAPATASQLDMAAQIYKIHPYKFKHPRILRSAFTHSSYPRAYEDIPHYQRLEFLGDAMFDMVAINYLFHAYPTRDPQWLTEHKMAMVSNQFLGALCVHLGLHKYLQHFMPAIQSSITAYVDEIMLARSAAEADAIRAGKSASELSPDWWISAKSPPKCLPDIVEAYIGAIFVDSQYSYDVVKTFFDMHVLPFFLDMRIYDTYANKHPVTFLTRFLEDNMGCRNFTCAASELPDVGDGASARIVAMVLIHGQVICHKEGTSARYAKVGVAKTALEKLKSLSLQDFRAKFCCDCCAKARESAEDEEKDVHGTQADIVPSAAMETEAEMAMAMI